MDSSTIFIKKALVIRFSSIGDIILTTPVIRCLAIQGAYEVHFLTQDRFANVLADNPYIAHIYTLDKNLFTISKHIRGRKYNVVFDLHNNIRSYSIRFFLFKKVHQFDKLRIKRWMRTVVKKGIDFDRHVVMRFLDTLATLGIVDDGKGLDFLIKKEYECPIHIKKGAIHIALVPGAQHFTKTMPPHISSTIVNKWPDVHFHIIGGDVEQTSTAYLNSFPNVTNHCGKLTLPQSASVLQQCKIVITTDTAMMHVAAALQKKIISVWGGTVPEFGFYPFFGNGGGKNIFIENNEISCRPCSKSGRSSCPINHFDCMTQISTNAIHSAIKEFITSNHLSKKIV
ncbi:MAG: glycosyltransferase family 9 protein [Saprospiraceae bacterium]